MAVDAALVVLAVVMVGLRLLARRTTKAALMADDYSIIIAVVRRKLRSSRRWTQSLTSSGIDFRDWPLCV